MKAHRDDISISLGSTAEADPFGLSVQVDGAEVLVTIPASAPGRYRTARRSGDAPFVAAGAFLEAGAIAGFLQQGVLTLPVIMPERGWLAAAAADGAVVEHGTPLIRYIRATEAITP
jgi:hypothetical protein